VFRPRPNGPFGGGHATVGVFKRVETEQAGRADRPVLVGSYDVTFREMAVGEHVGPSRLAYALNYLREKAERAEAGLGAPPEPGGTRDTPEAPGAAPSAS
jgi:hypothetical protein